MNQSTTSVNACQRQLDNAPIESGAYLELLDIETMRAQEDLENCAAWEQEAHNAGNQSLARYYKSNADADRGKIEGLKLARKLAITCQDPHAAFRAILNGAAAELTDSVEGRR